MSALYHVREYLGPRSLAVAYRSFVRPVCEYGSAAFKDTVATHLSNFDKIQMLAERLSGCVFPALQSCREANAIRFVCKLLDFMDVGTATFLSSFCHSSYPHIWIEKSG